MEGSIRKGFTILISGISDSNLLIITKQSVTIEDVIYIKIDNTKEEILSAMNRFSRDAYNIDLKDIASKHPKRIFGSDLKLIVIHEQRSKKDINE